MGQQGADRFHDEPSRLFQSAIWRLDRVDAAALILAADRLAYEVRRHGAAQVDRDASAQAVDAILRARFGRCDDRLRRAGVAAMAARLDRRGAEVVGWMDGSVRKRLARRLVASGPYVREGYARDAGLASGLILPVAPLHVVAPALHQGERVAMRLRRAVGASARIALAHGAGAGCAWLGRTRLSAWAELHLDLEACSAFHPVGFAQAYLRLAGFLRARGDIVGVRAASWLYDPKLAAVSPNLAFVRDQAEAGGARFFPVRTEESQVAFAAARSPERRRLIETGAYRPACHAMSWLTEDLLAWVSRAPLAEAA